MFKFEKGGIYHEPTRTLTVADLHLGTHTFPENQDYPELTNPKVEQKIYGLIEKYNPEKVIFNGDTFTTRVPTKESIHTINKILNFDYESIFIIGNHEEKAENITDFVSGDTVTDEYLQNGTLYHHGHTHPQNSSPVEIIGHLHPTIKSGNIEKKAYLKLEFNKKKIIVLPAFNPGVKGKSIKKQLNTYPRLSEAKNIYVKSIDSTGSFRKLSI